MHRMVLQRALARQNKSSTAQVCPRSASSYRSHCLVVRRGSSAVSGVGNTAFESTINGESAFAGKTMALGRSKSSTIIEGNEHDQKWDASDSSGRNLA